MEALRVRYQEGQLLRAADLNAEQAYLTVVRRRHNVAEHGWGIVSGLALAPDAQGLALQPGMAIDGFGRELLVSEAVVVSWQMQGADGAMHDLFDIIGSDPDPTGVRLISVSLNYGLVAVNAAGAPACARHDRWQEEAQLSLAPATDADPRYPAEVAAGDLNFAPQDTPPDDPARLWPVFLGRVARCPNPYNDYIPYTYTYLPADRPYATLTGQMVLAASGRARMQVDGNEPGEARFAISLPTSSIPAAANSNTGGANTPATTAASTTAVSTGVALTVDSLADERLSISAPVNGAALAALGGPVTVAPRPVRRNAPANAANHLKLAPRPARLGAADILLPAELAATLRDAGDPVSAYVLAHLPSYLQNQLASHPDAFTASWPLRRLLARGLNTIIDGGDTLYDTGRFANITLREQTTALIQWRDRAAATDRDFHVYLIALLNRMLLEDAYPTALAVSPSENGAAWSAIFCPLPAAPTAAAPWELYRAAVKGKDPAMIDRLHLEIFDPNGQGDPTRYQFVVGHRDPGGDFQPCLSVGADCVVTIYGALNVNGELVQGVPDTGGGATGGGGTGGAGGGILDTTSLRVAIDGSGLKAGRAAAAYTVTLTNTASAAISSIMVQSTTSMPGAVSTTLLGQNLSVGAAGSGAESAPVTGTLNLANIGAGASITVIITALGVSQGGGEVFAAGSVTVTA
jgi:hypothetical protein